MLFPEWTRHDRAWHDGQRPPLPQTPAWPVEPGAFAPLEGPRLALGAAGQGLEQPLSSLTRLVGHRPVTKFCVFPPSLPCPFQGQLTDSHSPEAINPGSYLWNRPLAGLKQVGSFPTALSSGFLGFLPLGHLAKWGTRQALGLGAIQD